MTPHQTIAVAVRLFAIWLFVSLTTGLVTFARQFRMQDYPNKGLTMGLIAVITVAVVLALWFFPQTVARRLLSTPAALSSETSSVPADTWLAMGCAVVGLWALASALPATIRDVIILESSDAITATSEVRTWLLYDLGRLVIAAWLMFGAVGFRKIFWWARYAGIGEPSNNRSRGP